MLPLKAEKPICIDLFAGLGGWADGFLAEGYRVIGFDIERHCYGDERYPGDLVLQDARTLHGRQFRNATCIVASPPCQRYSRMAMPFSIFKAEAARLRADTTGQEIAALNELFEQPFRIQREACEAAGRHIPMVVENVRGAQPWIGQAQARYGSYFLWGDVATAAGDGIYSGLAAPTWDSPILRAAEGIKFGGRWWNDEARAAFRNGGALRAAGVKQGGGWFHDAHGTMRAHSSASHARKAASMRIAKIPFALSNYIARQFLPAGVYSERACQGTTLKSPLLQSSESLSGLFEFPPLDKSPQPGAE